ncbi:MAG: metallophosphoesterase [Oscillospiraceae bacterium]|nr:metallophosphoesterase [Oscillospiraceae bacterium]
MSLFAIGDLHLSLGDSKKPMGIFNGWEDHTQKISDSFSSMLTPEDTVVLAGDTSWAMGLNNSLADFQFINSLPGRKIILKGNHDYWWSTRRKMDNFFRENSLDTLNILYNDFYEYNGYGICGTRGWVSIDGKTENESVMAKEVQRLEVSISGAESQNLEPIVFMHYPPVYGSSCNYDILDVLFRHGIKQCFYGHIHGYSQKNAVTGIQDGIEYRMISSDFLHFVPLKVM